MGEIGAMIRRGKLGAILSYLVCEREIQKDAIEDYEKELEESYTSLYKEIENLYPRASRADEDLVNSVMDFAEFHDEIYLEVGVLIGFQLY